MKASELKSLTENELNDKENDLRKELFNLRFRAVRGDLQNPMRIRAVKRDIARVLTVKREKQLNRA